MRLIRRKKKIQEVTDLTPLLQRTDELGRMYFKMNRDEDNEDEETKLGS